jgi:DNA-binding SARP family transcriptional activator
MAGRGRGRSLSDRSNRALRAYRQSTQTRDTDKGHRQGTQTEHIHEGQGAQSVMIKTEQTDSAHCVSLRRIARTDIQAVQQYSTNCTGFSPLVSH